MDRENSLTAFQLIQEECRARDAGLILTSLNETAFAKADIRLKL